MHSDNRPVLIMAGGTGGHVYPALAVARALLARDVPVVWLGTRKGLEARVVPESGIPVKWITVSGLRKKRIWNLLFAPLTLLYACLQSATVIASIRPRLVLGMGGFVAGPGGLVSKIMHKPLVIHEQNAIAGLTNRILARMANSVLQAFPNTFKNNVNAYHTGNPVREDIWALPEPSARMAERQGRLRLLIIGGSLGARFLNELVPKAIYTMPSGMWPEIYHQAGQMHIDSARSTYTKLGVEAEVHPFIEDMASAYAWADLVVCRSGAMTVAELAAAGLPSILVPYPHAVDDHQTANGRYLEEQGAAIIGSESELTAEQLGDWLSELTVDRQRLLQMANCARRLARPEATQLVVRECLAVAESF